METLNYVGKVNGFTSGVGLSHSSFLSFFFSRLVFLESLNLVSKA